MFEGRKREDGAGGFLNEKSLALFFWKDK